MESDARIVLCRKVLDEVDAADGVVVPILVLRHWLLVELRGHLLPFSGRHSVWHHGGGVGDLGFHFVPTSIVRDGGGAKLERAA